MNTLPVVSRLDRLRKSDLWWSFTHSWSARIAAVMLILLIGSAFLAPLIAPQNPYDATQLDMWKSELPPLWQAGGEWPYLLGTDTPVSYTHLDVYKRQMWRRSILARPAVRPRSAPKASQASG